MEKIILDTDEGADISIIRQKVLNELLLLGYNFKLKGTQYLLESIMYIYTKKEMNLLENLEKNVYKYISEKNNKSLLNIKTSIIKK